MKDQDSGRRKKFDACRTYWVSVGRSPPSWSKILTKIGTRNISIPVITSVANVSTTPGRSSRP